MNMVLVDQDQVLALRSALPAVTKVWLQEILGVSETTWRSMRDGKPIRESTYNRLLAKLERTTARARSPNPFPSREAGRSAGQTVTWANG